VTGVVDEMRMQDNGKVFVFFVFDSFVCV